MLRKMQVALTQARTLNISRLHNIPRLWDFYSSTDARGVWNILQHTSHQRKDMCLGKTSAPMLKTWPRKTYKETPVSSKHKLFYSYTEQNHFQMNIKADMPELAFCNYNSVKWRVHEYSPWPCPSPSIWDIGTQLWPNVFWSRWAVGTDGVETGWGGLRKLQCVVQLLIVFWQGVALLHTMGKGCHRWADECQWKVFHIVVQLFSELNRQCHSWKLQLLDQHPAFANFVIEHFWGPASSSQITFLDPWHKMTLWPLQLKNLW